MPSHPPEGWVVEKAVVVDEGENSITVSPPERRQSRLPD